MTPPLNRLGLLALLALCTPAQAVTDAANGFSVTPPPGWVKVSYPGTVLIYHDPAVHQGFSSNVSVAVQPLPPGMTLEQYTALSEKQLSSLITGLHGSGIRSVQLGGVAGQELRYSGMQGKYRLYWESAYVLRDGKAYLLTGTAVQGQQAAISAVMKRFVTSFKFTR